MKPLTRKMAIPFGRLVRRVFQIRRATGLARRRPLLIVFSLHRVLPVQVFWLRPSLVISPSSLRGVLEEITGEFKSLPPQDLLAFLGDGRTVRGDAVCLSFDDGYADVYENGRTLMREFGVRAWFFVTTGFLDRTHRLWWDVLLASALGNFDRGRPEKASRDRECVPAYSAWRPEPRWAEVNRAIPKLRVAPPGGRLAWSAATTAISGTDDVEELLPPPLTWEQVRDLQGDGHAIGSHGVSHLEFAFRSLADVAEELRMSAARIREETGKRPVAFAYPGGVLAPVPEEVFREVGIRAAFTTQYGLVRPGDSPFLLRRVNLCEEVVAERPGIFRRELLFAAIGGFFERPTRLRQVWKALTGGEE